MIRFLNLKKQYNGRTVLDIEELALEQEKIHVVVGPNGSGKTTLLRLISGLEKPTLGSIESPFAPNDIAFCFQKPYLFRGSVRHNLEMGLWSKKPGKNAESMDKVMKKLGISSLADAWAKSLSAGEAQRVSLARSILREPKLLLLDEPTANIDPESLDAIENMISEMLGSGTTLIMATHSVDRAYHLSESIFRLEKGRLAPPEIQNVFTCRIFEQEGRTIAAIGKSLSFEVATGIRGPARMAIPNTDIILSCQILKSSMRNSFPGRVTGLRENGNSVEASIDVGEAILKARITFASLHEMKLTVGSEVCASFKATAVKVF